MQLTTQRMDTSSVEAREHDPETYWSRRYASIDITKSGHINLPLQYNRWLYRRKQSQLARGLRSSQFAARNSTVLEAAVGSGVYVEMWQAKGVKQLTGIDISQNAISWLQRRFPRFSFIKADLTVPNLAALTGKGFDLVTAFDVLYYIDDDSKFDIALRNLAETVKPGGWLAIHDPILPHQELLRDHRKLRTIARYKAALSKAGFQIVWRRPTFFFAVQPRSTQPFWAQPRLMKGIWSRLTGPSIRRFPNASGCIVYWLDRWLGMLFRDGPSYCMLICRKVTS